MNEQPYPAHWEVDVVLRDGSVVHLRPIGPTDADALQDFHAQLSDESVYLRFFAPYPVLSQRDVERFTVVDHDHRSALVATDAADAGQIVGVARYEELPGNGDGSVTIVKTITETTAEMALIVRDDHQGRGIGTVLLQHLATAAAERGIGRFIADVLPRNERMVAVFFAAGFSPTIDLVDGVLRVEFAIGPPSGLPSGLPSGDVHS